MGSSKSKGSCKKIVRRNLRFRYPQTKSVVIRKPWGYEDHVLIKDGFCVKRLVLNKGKMSSFHLHNMKSEIFFIRRGSATIRFKNSAQVYKKGQFLYLPKGTLHQIINIGKSPLEIVEFSYPYSSADVIRKEDPWEKLRKQKKLA